MKAAFRITRIFSYFKTKKPYNNWLPRALRTLGNGRRISSAGCSARSASQPEDAADSGTETPKAFPPFAADPPPVRRFEME